MSCDVTSSSSGQSDVGQSISWWGDKVLVIITGASRGLGKSIAIKLSSRFHQVHKNKPGDKSNIKISFLLLSRFQEHLERVKHEISRTGFHVGNVQLIPGSLNDYETISALDFILEHERRDYDQVILIHNAGTLGDPDRLVDNYSPHDISELNEYGRVNLTSAIIITSSFLRAFKVCSRRILINISSLAALQPMKGLALYGSFKAARDQYFKSVAFEDPATRVLSYAPGPLKTEMAVMLGNRGHLKEFFQNSNNILEPEQSVEKMIQILENDNYDNGAHIDYYDQLP